ncbi:Zn(2+)-responsive transcriptional regulator [Psychromonas sp. MB-3u-54]|uniref:Zn(2+)-responsive transcriptional regulator n=1 Tax=Psychromonas sp. MB-3u-54 TaxID=2058319 RepID=UPI000C337CD4|nr:Zn(2+)-responsive transcriptional regulator [Psychromonas sp. MB-3u-54]PKH03819.1 Zn(2+)-responsive transcriptional regulator [Psychromonas sp. MB-3u-54]
MYRIGELATLCKIKTDTLRFYDKQGLFVPSSRTESGYRLYTKKDAQRLRFILRAKTIGFTLVEISELLSIELDKSNKACADVKSLVDLKLADISQKIEQLHYFKNALQQLSSDCCGGPESAQHCSILEALESTSSAKNRTNNGHHQAHSHATK